MKKHNKMGTRAYRILFLAAMVIAILLIPSSFALEGFSSPQASVSLGDSLVVSDSVVYSSGFVSDDGQTWEQFSFTGRARGNWIVGQATSNVRTDANYYAIYSCSWNSGWSCSDGWEVYDQSSEEETPSEYIPKDSLEGDFEALKALYASTQGQQLEVVSSPDELPPYAQAQYPYMYMINGDIYGPKFNRPQFTARNDFDGWYNYGKPWTDKTGWQDMTPETMGDAVGVEVNDNGRVIILDMQKVMMDGENTLGNNLAGTLPPEIGNLKQLVHLNVKQNFFIEEIPAELGLLTNLERLSLGGQQGEIDITRAKDWNEPNHRGIRQPGGKRYEETNLFYGPIPPELGNLENLKFLEIRRQYLTGTLPPELGNIQGIKAFMIGGSKAPVEVKLHGEIPPEYGAWSEIEIFHVAGYTGNEQISGEFPPEVVEGWKNIKNINVAGNRMTGPIPEFLHSRDKKYMHFASNEFTGGFPTGYFNGNNSGMSALKLRDNKLTGPLPQTLPQPTYPFTRDGYPTGTMRYDKNSFTGPVPDWVQEAPVIQYQLNANEFTGELAVNDNDRMRLFWLHGNNFSGEIPDANWSSPALYSILIGGNNLSGSIPDSWSSMVTEQTDSQTGEYTGRLWRFEAQRNELSGEIPAWFADVKTMTRLKIQENRFTFKDILPHYEAILATMQREASREESRDSQANYEYAPQKSFGKSESLSLSVGQELTIDFSDDVGYEGNEYVWTKDGEVLSGFSDNVLSISSVSTSNDGEYVLRVTNPSLPELTLYSQSVSVTVQ